MRKVLFILSLIIIWAYHSNSQDLRFKVINLKDASLSQEELYEKINQYKRQIQEEPQNYALKAWLLNCYIYTNQLDTAYKYSNKVLQHNNIESKEEYPVFLAFKGYYELYQGNNENANTNFEILIKYYNNKLKEDCTDFEYKTNLAFFQYLHSKEKNVIRKYIESIDFDRSMAKELELFFIELEMLNENQLIEKLKTFKYQLPYDEVSNCHTKEMMQNSLKESADLKKYKDYDFLAHNYKFLDSNYRIIMTRDEYEFYMDKYNVYPPLKNYSDSLLVPLIAEFENNEVVVSMAKHRITMSWEELGQYLWLTEAEAKVMAGKYNFKHPYRLYEYCKQTDENKWDNSTKEFMNNLRDKVYAEKKDSLIYSMPNYKILQLARMYNPDK